MSNAGERLSTIYMLMIACSDIVFVWARGQRPRSLRLPECQYQGHTTTGNY